MRSWNFSVKNDFCKYRMRWLNCRHFIYLISYMRLVWFWFCWLHSVLGSSRHCFFLQKCHPDVIHSDRNSATALCTAWHSQRIPNTNISVCLAVNLMIFHSLMVITRGFVMITNDGDVMPAFIFARGYKLKSEAYIKWVEEVLLPWIKMVAAGRTCLTTGLCNMLHIQESTVMAVRQFLQPHNRLHLATHLHSLQSPWSLCIKCRRAGDQHNYL